MARKESAQLALILRQAETFYINSPAGVTLDQVAAELGISIHTLKDASSKGGWEAARLKRTAAIQQQIIDQQDPELRADQLRVAKKAWRLMDMQLDRIYDAMTATNEAGELKMKVKSIKDDAAALRAIYLIAQDLARVPGSTAGTPLSTNELDTNGRPMGGTNLVLIQQLIANTAPQRTSDPEGRIIDEPGNDASEF